MRYLCLLFFLLSACAPTTSAGLRAMAADLDAQQAEQERLAYEQAQRDAIDWLTERYTTHPSNLIDMPYKYSPDEHSVGSDAGYSGSHHVADIEAGRDAENYRGYSSQKRGQRGGALYNDLCFSLELLTNV